MSFALPSQDAVAAGCAEKCHRLAYSIVRWKNVLIAMLSFQRVAGTPEKIKNWILGLQKSRWGPITTSPSISRRATTPGTAPVLHSRRRSVSPRSRGESLGVTDEIESFTENGLRLRSGESLEVDIIVTATGLKVQLMGGMESGGWRASRALSSDELQRHDVQ